jgi:hypothetical protein
MSQGNKSLRLKIELRADTEDENNRFEVERSGNGPEIIAFLGDLYNIISSYDHADEQRKLRREAWKTQQGTK